MEPESSTTRNTYELLESNSYVQMILEDENASPLLLSAHSFDSTATQDDMPFQIQTPTPTSTSTSQPIIRKRKVPSAVWTYFEDMGDSGLRCLICDRNR
jgi:hypothetical protein